VSLEANHAEAALTQMVPAAERLGFGVHTSGSLMPLNAQSEPYVALSLSNERRFRRNRKTLAELLFDLVGVPYEGEEYIVCPSEADVVHAREALREAGVEPERDTIVALATGGDSARFANKDWPTEHWLALGRALGERDDLRVVLVGGPMEREINRALGAELAGLVANTGCEHSIMQFCALLRLCEVVVCTDCFPMHAAVAVKTPVVSLFGPTPPQEMAIFGRGRKIVTELACAPCYIRAREDCPHEWACMRGIRPEVVAEAVLEVLAERA
ncbi:MAG: glycosyltransferase family 9 protein, partial [Armatimonadota bacterium]